jgi:hypothetical protein
MDELAVECDARSEGSFKILNPALYKAYPQQDFCRTNSKSKTSLHNFDLISSFGSLRNGSLPGPPPACRVIISPPVIAPPRPGAKVHRFVDS